MNPSRSPRHHHCASSRRRSADEIWAELTRAALLTPPEDNEADLAHAPLGFSTRVAALGLAERRAAPSLLEAFSLRALGLASLAAALALVAHFSVPQSVAAADEEFFFTVEDPSSLLLGETGGGLYE